jgi:hypothetical protein
VTVNDQGPESAPASPNWAGRVGRLGLDWWATIVAGAVVLLAVAGLLPRIPW